MPFFFEAAADQGRDQLHGQDPSFEFAPWVRQLWALLDNQGVMEVEEEGAVMYLQSYSSHRYDRWHEGERTIRLDGDYQDWQHTITEVWSDLF